MRGNEYVHIFDTLSLFMTERRLDVGVAIPSRVDPTDQRTTTRVFDLEE
jgi:hypothetical protein